MWMECHSWMFHDISASSASCKTNHRSNASKVLHCIHNLYSWKEADLDNVQTCYIVNIVYTKPVTFDFPLFFRVFSVGVYRNRLNTGVYGTESVWWYVLVVTDVSTADLKNVWQWACLETVSRQRAMEYLRFASVKIVRYKHQNLQAFKLAINPKQLPVTAEELCWILITVWSCVLSR